jgi:hypothetical protein
MDRNQKIADILRREVLWLLIGFELAGLLYDSFHFSGWLGGSNGLLFGLIPIAIFASLAFFSRHSTRQS